MNLFCAALSSTSLVKSWIVTAIPFNSTLFVSKTDCKTILKVLAGSPKLNLKSSFSFSLFKIDSIFVCKSLDKISGISFKNCLPSRNLPSQRNNLFAVGLVSTILPCESNNIAPSAIVAINDCCLICAAFSSSILASS